MTRSQFSWRHPLAAILLLALALRVAATWQPSIAHPDEIFQYLEQAHRALFGYGFIPWEYRDGMRAWAIPLLLAGPMWLGSLLPGDSYLLLPRLAVALSTLGVVWGAWSLGARESRLHALLAALVAAVWWENVFYAAHTLTETMATAAAIPAFALLLRARHLRLAGALLAFATVARFHYAPVFALVVLWRTGRDLGAWRALLLGAAPVLALSALADWSMDLTPFSWLEANFRRNVIDGAARNYGIAGPLFYLRALGELWGWAFVPITFLAILGSRRQPVLLAAAILTIALHSGIAHKEPRFVQLGTTLILILAAMGTAGVLRMTRTPARWAALAAAGWVALSLGLATTGDRRWRWTDQAPAMAAVRQAGEDPRLCGLATFDTRYWQFAGYVALHRPVPVYALSAADELGFPAADARAIAPASPSFNMIMTTPAGMDAIPPGYTQIGCRIPWAPAPIAERRARAICLYRRPGGCDPAPARPWLIQ